MQVRLPFLFLSTSTKSRIFTFRAMATANGTSNHVLNRITPDQVSREIKDPVDPTALEQAKAIMAELMDGDQVGASKLLVVAKRLGDIKEDATKYTVTPEECKAAFEGLSEIERTALVNIHGRVKAFADAQRKSVTDMEMDIPGGKAGHKVSPCKGTVFFYSVNLRLKGVRHALHIN
jgi:histidinol dehydrogenase